MGVKSKNTFKRSSFQFFLRCRILLIPFLFISRLFFHLIMYVGLHLWPQNWLKLDSHSYQACLHMLNLTSVWFVMEKMRAFSEFRRGKHHHSTSLIWQFLRRLPAIHVWCKMNKIFKLQKNIRLWYFVWISTSHCSSKSIIELSPRNLYGTKLIR